MERSKVVEPSSLVSPNQYCLLESHLWFDNYKLQTIRIITSIKVKCKNKWNQIEYVFESKKREIWKAKSIVCSQTAMSKL